MGDHDYYTHFRGLDVEIGRWKGVDPKWNQSESPYISMGNNPIRNFDAIGDTVWNFNSKTGAFMGLTELDKAGHIGKSLTINEKVLADGSKSYTRTTDYAFGFNDIDVDKNDILQGRLTLRFITDVHIDKAMDLNGVKTDLAQSNPLLYIERESRPRGSASVLSGISSGLLDHIGNSQVVRRGSLNLVLMPGSRIGMAYNSMDYGNFLWGHAGRILGFDPAILLGAAHLNNALNGETDNPGKVIPLLDTRADQRAIFMGTFYPVKK